MTNKDDGFSHRLKAHREAAGFTLAELAERAGISKTYLWELEKDEAGEKSPSVDVAKRLAAALSIGLLELVGDDGPQSIKAKAEKIRQRLKEHDAKRKIIEAELVALQHACPHENVETWHDDGWGRMPSNEWQCNDCGLHKSS